MKNLQLNVLGTLLLFSLLGISADSFVNNAEKIEDKSVITTLERHIPRNDFSDNELVDPSKEMSEIKQVNDTQDVKEAKKETPAVATTAKAPTALVNTKSSIREHIVRQSLALGVDPAIGLALAKTESNFDHSKRSTHGAVGVFQILPSTARSMGYNAYHINDNIKSGLLYYKKMHQKFGSTELALAAYNAGPGNVSRYKGVPPFAETKRFIAKINNEYTIQKSTLDPILEKVQNNDL